MGRSWAHGVGVVVNPHPRTLAGSSSTIEPPYTTGPGKLLCQQFGGQQSNKSLGLMGFAVANVHLGVYSRPNSPNDRKPTPTITIGMHRTNA